ncbi:hypothetical protein [Lysobacter sp. ESA13C]|uniref:hypothetical protein n=1 Tax=Lysobacter sp. ESA13C TaxID=2862676 RepID=UPI001CC0D016|nr:hypothetical protein [Lysobacter sp. ESA13C]
MNERGNRIPERKRAKLTGRGKGHSILRLPHFLLDSAEFSRLSGNAIKLLLDAATEFKGSNNGNLNLAWSRLSQRGWVSQGTAHRAKHELLSSGFLACTRHGGKNRCSLYAITWEPIDRCQAVQLEVAAQQVASHLWRKPCSEFRNQLLPKSEQPDQIPWSQEVD